MVEAFANQGAAVSFIDILVQEETLVQELKNQDCKVCFLETDVRDHDALIASIQTAAQDFGPITTLVNNVANDQRHAVMETTQAWWAQCMDINLNASFWAAQSVYPMMKKQAGGSIINVSSINALWGPDNMPGYVTAKAGLLGMTKALAREFGKDRVRVNTISPGWVVTERQKKLWLTPEAEKEWKKLLCLPDMIEPEEVASLALFLASDDSQKITSQNFIIDCGRI
ncbi:MAG: SDR family oxidoreductase [Bdellovibrionota bacterium]